ncbi:MAG: flagellar biosynthesis regulator FlhF [Alphaproteobacteria bacterium HGW-Alphaproteobacteria-1]|nr:MAG: flagellar biosynthesis regulator FlhF [Alphaproteobacteria bacterium HGW-Alphaproteobacteria-1]
MTAVFKAQAAYRTEVQTVRTARAQEYDALARVTHRLRVASQASNPDIGQLAAAVHDNQRLWITFSVDVADSQNGLPVALRAQILGLANFTRAHSSRVLREGASLDPLVDINTAVMRGLSGAGASQ